MNILIIGTTDIVGGAARVSWDLKESLEKNGHSVSMFVADKKSTDPNVFVIPRPKWRKILGFLLATENLISTDWILKTKQFLEADIVHCHNLHGRFFNLKTLQKMSLLKPLIWTLHDAWAITPHCAHTFESEMMKYGLLACPSINIPPRTLWDNDKNLAEEKIKTYNNSRLHIVVPCRWLKDRVEKTVLKNQDLRLIPNGVDTAIFHPQDKMAARMDLGLPKDKKIVLFLADDARKNTWKGWIYTEKVIEYFKDREDLLFMSVGNYSKVEDEKNVRNIGRINDKRTLAKYYAAADVLLFTSIAETFPLVTLESMACGLPVVSFDVGGVKEAIQNNENGYIAKYKDVGDLIAGLNWFLNLNDEQKKNISETSSQKTQKLYNDSLMIDRYLNLYQELISANLHNGNN